MLLFPILAAAALEFAIARRNRCAFVSAAMMVLYFLGLLAAILADNGGPFIPTVLPWALVLNPADASGISDLAALGAVEAASGLSGAAATIAPWKPLLALALWPLAAAGAARAAFERGSP